jgi:outer membrane protein assembly factor BamB
MRTITVPFSAAPEENWMLSRCRNTRISLAPLAVTVFAVAGLLHASDWPMFRGNEAKTGYTNDITGLPDSKAAWIDTLHCALISSPSVKGDVLCIGGRDSCITAVNIKSGKILWKKRTLGWVDSSPLLIDDRAVIGSRDGAIYVFQLSTGEQLGVLNAGLQLSSPVALDKNTVFSGLGPPFSSGAAFDVSLPSWNRSSVTWSVRFSQMSYSSPCLFGTTAVIGASDGMLYGIDLNKKATRWSVQTQGDVYLSTPAVSDSTVYFAPGGYDYNVYAIAVRDGLVFWKASPSGVVSVLPKRREDNDMSVVLYRELLRLSPQARQRIIDSMNTNTQGSLAKSSTSSSVSGTASASAFFSYNNVKTSSVAVDANNVYFIQKELGDPKPKFTITAMDNYSGEVKWQFSELRSCVQMGYSSSPVVVHDKVFFGWGEGLMYALDAKTGRKLWCDTLNGDIISSPAIASGKLFVATMAGYLYSFNLTATPQGSDFQTGTFCYPNPARGSVSHIQLFVAKAAVADITLYNADEKPVFTSTRQLSANEKFTYDWNIANVANGVYFALVKVKYANGAVDRKVLKVAVLR